MLRHKTTPFIEYNYQLKRLLIVNIFSEKQPRGLGRWSHHAALNSLPLSSVRTTAAQVVAENDGSHRDNISLM